jgi:hypothetical protein
MKKVFFLFLFILTFKVFADEEGRIYDQGHAATKEQMSGGYNNTARIDVQGAWDCFVVGKFIWWQPKEEGLELAWDLRTTPPTPSQTSSFGRPLKMEFDFHPGFKAGLGFHFGADDWDIYCEYTRLYTTNKRSRIVEQWELFQLFIQPFWSVDELDEGDLFYVKGSWKLRYHMLDGILARPYYAGVKLTLKPFMGVRSGWISQLYNIHHKIFYSEMELGAKVFAKSSSFLIGPRVGVDGNWLLGGGFRFLGNVAFSVFYQYFKTRYTEFGFEPTNVVQNFLISKRDREKYFNPNLEISLGGGWGRYYGTDSWHVDITASYDVSVFWHQNMIRRIKDIASNDITYDPNIGNLILHGATVSLRLDF